MGQPLRIVQIGAVIRGFATGRHPGREPVCEGQNAFGCGGLAAPAPLLFETLLECSDDSRRQALARELGQLGGERVGFGILEVQALQNSALYG